LRDNPFTFPAHLKASEKYREALHQAVKHREQVLPYSVSQRLLDAEELKVVLSTRDYYNSVYKKLLNKSKPQTIVALLRILKNNKFVYCTRFEIVINRVTKNPVERKLIQFFFIYRQQLKVAAHFITD
jgi:hypothetical protein